MASRAIWKGQLRLSAGDDAAAAWAQVNAPAVLEGLVDFSAEISVIVARGADGAAIAAVATQGAVGAGAYAAVTAAALFWLVRRPLGTPSPVRTPPCADARRVWGA